MRRAQPAPIRRQSTALPMEDGAPSLRLPPRRISEKVSIITPTNRLWAIKNAVWNYLKQTHPNKELILILNSDEFERAEVCALVQAVPNCRVLAAPAKVSLGECMNRAIARSSGDLWTKMDDDDEYCPNHVANQLDLLNKAGAGAIGKPAFYIYLEELDTTILRKVGRLSGASLMARKSACKGVRFPRVNLGEDLGFVYSLRAQGVLTVNSPPEGMLVIRRPEQRSHTWKHPAKSYLAEVHLSEMVTTGRSAPFVERRNVGNVAVLSENGAPSLVELLIEHPRLGRVQVPALFHYRDLDLALGPVIDDGVVADFCYSDFPEPVFASLSALEDLGFEAFVLCSPGSPGFQEWESVLGAKATVLAQEKDLYPLFKRLGLKE